jgi:hypothetical protein
MYTACTRRAFQIDVRPLRLVGVRTNPDQGGGPYRHATPGLGRRTVEGGDVNVLQLTIRQIRYALSCLALVAFLGGTN